ncbi:MAG: Transcriptional regulator, PaaX family [Microgenomates group bacterium GW2011_GWA1_48_10]|nr:MAG: Transcriptional regulator, PaaX family [Microgenomates group bacterium GW2011_GWA1_48_10]
MDNRSETLPHDLPKELSDFLLKQLVTSKARERNEKIKKVLLLLAAGSSLALAIASPRSTRLLTFFQPDRSDWDDWKLFNRRYLQNTIRRLQREKIIETEGMGDYQTVKITEKGKTKVLQFAIESVKIDPPSKWDHKWWLVFYDIKSSKKSIRDRFQRILRSAGFYPLQESVYIHAYPCETQVEFLRSFLGINGEVRLILAERIENDEQFRKYFGV